MRRSTPRFAGVALVTIAGLVLVGCSSKAPSTSSTGTSSGGTLTIQPLVQIDKSGKEVKAQAGGAPATPAGDGKATCAATTTIAMAGALTGANAALGINIENGVKLAIKQHNDANKDCQVQFKGYDTEGDPAKAPAVATQIINNADVIGLIGPAFSGETKATGGAFHDAGLLSLTASATNPALTTNGWNNFFRGLANDAVQGPSVAAYLVNTAGFKKVCVVKDDSDYGVGLAQQITTGLGSAADTSCALSVKTGDKDFSSAVQSIKSAAPDAIFYAGYYAEAAPFVAQLRDGGVTAKFVSADGTNDPQFVKQAGSASKDALLSCPCGPAPADFEKAYEAQFNVSSGVYSVEAYDLGTIVLKAIDSGAKDRASVVNFIKGYSGDGLARHYQWDATGELASALIWIYQVK